MTAINLQLEARAKALLHEESICPVRWIDGSVHLLDQRRLPFSSHDVVCGDAAAVTKAIKDMVVRGAPAIGVAGAYGTVLAARDAYATAGENWRDAFAEAAETLRSARPTAINLHWAVERMRRCCHTWAAGDPSTIFLTEALNIHAEDIAACRAMGSYGADLLDPGSKVITHCNAGALATGGYGTALGVIRTGYRRGRIAHVYVDETRPWLQGARLTAWELVHEGIPATLLADCAAAFRLRQRDITWMIVGADRIAANGDTANKIGTYGLALAAKAHGVKVMVVAPCSTFDFSLSDGSAIPIESREPRELLDLAGQPVAARGIDAWNPVFDVTPAHLIDAIVTERGVVRAPDTGKLASLQI